MEKIQKTLALISSRLRRVPQARVYAVSHSNSRYYQHNNHKERLLIAPLANFQNHREGNMGTRRDHSLSGDSFREAAKRKHMGREMEKVKRMRMEREKLEYDALKILAAAKPVEILTDTELKKLLAWQQVKNKTDWKRCDRLEAWNAIKDYNNLSSTTFEKWTDEDEANLNTLRHQKTLI